ncbi:DUF885 family protein [Granulicella sp. S156]|uniref:DUF885 domain-containing protein n=1 Tax=Granulicella sp. S156 TaxID=1747224 RepID=UPI00131B17C0|nr:DUF885 domain-containing protein [Granulicella sp. S156]
MGAHFARPHSIKRATAGGFGGLVLAVLFGTAIASAQSVQARSQALNAVFTDYWQDHLRHTPEDATVLGDKRYNDRWSDLSAEEVQRSVQRSREYIQRLRAIDTTGLSKQDKLSAELLLRNLLEDQESVQFKEWEMPVNQIHGIHFELPQLVAVIPFDDVKDYDNYIARLKRVPLLFDQLTADMKLGIDDGHVQPKLVSEKVLAQINSIVAIKLEDSPFYAPTKKFPAGISVDEQRRITGEISDVIAHDVIPAYQRFARFLETQYIPHGRTEPGIWAIPNGDAYYAFCIRSNTTLHMTADQIHQIGLDEVKRDEAAMLVIANKLGYKDLKSFNAAIKANRKLHAASKEQLLDTYRADLDQMKTKLPELFGTLPKADLVVEATPAYTEKQRPAATYEPGSPDGKRPGRVVVNTYNFSEIYLGGAESIAYHEGIPGHHLQFSIALELSGIPEFRKKKEYTAYTEGWGLYAEQLGKDVGFYQDPYSDYGRLQGDIWRAIRLVVDTGLHSKHWTRQQVVDYFHEHSSIDETNVQRETDRYIAWPGQALGYKVGQLKLLEFRQRAQTQLGAKFDIRKFHDLILDSGALPLDVLDISVNDWIASQK